MYFYYFFSFIFILSLEFSFSQTYVEYPNKFWIPQLTNRRLLSLLDSATLSDYNYYRDLVILRYSKLKNDEIKSISTEEFEAMTNEIFEEFPLIQRLFYHDDSVYWEWRPFIDSSMPYLDSLIYNKEKTFENSFDNIKCVTTKKFAKEGIIAQTPFFNQKIRYDIFVSDTRTIIFHIEFAMMLTKLESIFLTDSIKSNNQPICRITIEAHKDRFKNFSYDDKNSLIIKDSILTGQSFRELNKFEKIKLFTCEWELLEDDYKIKFISDFDHIFANQQEMIKNLIIKIYWYGNREYQLSIRDIKMMDHRGMYFEHNSEIVKEMIKQAKEINKFILEKKRWIED
jgi:hypothetical protein